jgi:hypothetical protein
MTRRNLASRTIITSTGLVALALAASAFTTTPAAAATGIEPATTYCLSSDNGTDCSFASHAQCEATASGGLGTCTVSPMWQEPRDRFAGGRLAPRPRG